MGALSLRFLPPSSRYRSRMCGHGARNLTPGKALLSIQAQGEDVPGSHPAADMISAKSASNNRIANWSSVVEDKMSKKKPKKPQEKPLLVSQYRAIGPAAVTAALLYAGRKKKPVQKFIAPRPA